MWYIVKIYHYDLSRSMSSYMQRDKCASSRSFYKTNEKLAFEHHGPYFRVTRDMSIQNSIFTTFNTPPPPPSPAKLWGLYWFHNGCLSVRSSVEKWFLYSGGILVSPWLSVCPSVCLWKSGMRSAWYISSPSDFGVDISINPKIVQYSLSFSFGALKR